MSAKSQTPLGRLAAMSAMGLADFFFPSPVQCGDVRLVAHGRLHLWPEFKTLPADQRALIMRFLRHCPEELTERGGLRAEMVIVLQQGTDFRLVPEDSAETQGPLAVPAKEVGPDFWAQHYEVVPGRPLVERIEHWLDELVQRRQSRVLPWCEGEGEALIRLRADDELAFKVPADHLPECPKTRVLETAPAQEHIPVDPDVLADLARRIDASSEGPLVRYEDVVMRKFLPSLRSGSDDDCPKHIEAGRTQLLIAPTAAGKTVFTELLALARAEAGDTVVMVVPDIRTVWAEVRKLRQAAEAAGLEMDICGLQSWRKIGAHLTADLVDTSGGAAARQNLLADRAYSCYLTAYATGKEVEFGSEPCMRLRQVRADGRLRRVQCPFSRQCGRFSGFEQALRADVIVVNHHAFLAGRWPFPVQDGQGTQTTPTIGECLLRLASLVVIDEVDLLQKIAIEQLTSGEAICARPGQGNALAEFMGQIEARRPAQPRPSGTTYEQLRQATLGIAALADSLAEAVDQGIVQWPDERITWAQSHDGALARAFYGKAGDGVERVRALYDASHLEDPAEDEIRDLLHQASDPDVGPEHAIGALKQRVRAWLANHGRAADWSTQQFEWACNALVLRAKMLRLDKLLGLLRYQLPQLEEEGHPQASFWRDALVGYTRWSFSPAGALGRRLYGYQMVGKAGERHILHVQGLSGDPHGTIQQLGGLVSEAVTGGPRAVLGLSATGRFLGAPSCDVIAPVWAYRRDTDRNVRIHTLRTDHRISGQSRPHVRRSSMQRSVKQLWNELLHAQLLGAYGQALEPGRRRALLVTASYDEASAAAEALSREVPPTVSVVPVRRRGEQHTGLEHSITTQELEAFARFPEPAILIAPLNIIARGHNIVQPDRPGQSALGSIFLLTRPVPPTNNAAHMLRHVSYGARISPPAWAGAHETVVAENRQAWKRLERLQRSHGAFGYMDPSLRRELVCDVLVDLIQLAGRARRGGTPADLYLVDAAFQDDYVPWTALVREVLDDWDQQEALEQMHAYHGAVVEALARYADYPLPDFGHSERDS